MEYSETRKRVVPENLNDYPEPIRRYFNYIFTDTCKLIHSTEIKYHGQFRKSPQDQWKNITAKERHNALFPAFEWWGKLFPIYVKDQYLNGEGKVSVKLLKLIQLAELKGPEANQGSLLRWLSEAVWFPTALFNSDFLKWEEIDSKSARVIINHHGIQTDGIFTVNVQGEVISFKAKRYMEYKLENWLTYYRNYEEVNGIQVPMSGGAIWQLESGNFPYIRLEMDQIDYKWEP